MPYEVERPFWKAHSPVGELCYILCETHYKTETGRNTGLLNFAIQTARDAGAILVDRLGRTKATSILSLKLTLLLKSSSSSASSLIIRVMQFSRRSQAQLRS
jgi:hypothetical protein